MVKLRCWVRARAMALGRNPSASAVCLTRWRVASVIRPVSLSALEAVATLTPATRATS
ncbi:hypothetical protein D3C87_1711620 [compost metagenome]